MARIRRERQHVLVNTVGLERAVLQRSDDKRVAKRMETRSRNAGLTLYSSRAQTGMEDAANRAVAQPVSTKRYKKVVLRTRNQAALGDVLFQRRRRCLMKRNQTGFAKLRHADQKSVWCDVVHAQIERFRYT